MVRIVNWILTRRCNLRCSYCGIVRDLENKPEEYPSMLHYYQNEMSTEFILESLNRLQKHNPNCFHIWYGGEPFLRNDLSEIINHCHKIGAHYTIISNNSPAIQERIVSLFEVVGQLEGFSSSVDPVYDKKFENNDIVKKSFYGHMNMTRMFSNNVKDLVAEITVTNDTVKHLWRLVKDLSEANIYSSITFLDISKNPYYDFANVYNEDDLVHPSEELSKQLDMIFNDGLLVHMGKDLVDQTLSILPSNLDCKLEEGIHNLTVDADGSVRLCLRIRGVNTPKMDLLDYIMEDGSLSNNLITNIVEDKKNYCEGCNHTCMIMSKLVDDGDLLDDKIIHTERRNY
jgi:MoaA/NifB/PqqE/SkfB family radical SAM enzyme